MKQSKMLAKMTNRKPFVREFVQPKEFKFEQQPCVGKSKLERGVDCVKRAYLNQKEHALKTQWGTLLAFDQKLQQFESFYMSHHMWNTNDDETIVYDDLFSIRKGLEEFNFVSTDPENWKIKVIDGSRIKCNGNCYKAYWDLVDTYTPIYKGKYDALYITNFAVSIAWSKVFREQDINLMIDSVKEGKENLAFAG